MNVIQLVILWVLAQPDEQKRIWMVIEKVPKKEEVESDSTERM